MSKSEFEKQPSENKDYDYDWTLWMPSGDNISSSVVTADTGVTLGTKQQGDYIDGVWTESTTGKSIKQFISGGTDGTNYKVTCVMTTTAGRIDEREIIIMVREK